MLPNMSRVVTHATEPRFSLPHLLATSCPMKFLKSSDGAGLGSNARAWAWRHLKLEPEPTCWAESLPKIIWHQTQRTLVEVGPKLVRSKDSKTQAFLQAAPKSPDQQYRLCVSALMFMPLCIYVLESRLGSGSMGFEPDSDPVHHDQWVLQGASDRLCRYCYDFCSNIGHRQREGPFAASRASLGAFI
jgi:hypothetical protein